MNDDSAEERGVRERFPPVNRYVAANAVVFLALWGAASALAVATDPPVPWIVFAGIVADAVHSEVAGRLKRREAAVRERREWLRGEP